VDVVVSDESKEFVNAHGGVLYVRSDLHRCCRGPLTLLDTSTEVPSDADDYVPVEADDIIVKYQGDPVDRPHVLTIEVHGIARRHLMAYWDGCVYKL
jgi:hypothetical protein